MTDFLISPFTDFAFMRRALAGCLALALGATPVGVFLLLRRMSLMGDAMSHAILPGAALGYLTFGLSLGAMTIGGIIAGLFVVLAAGVVTRASVLKEDASLAAFYLLSLAAGVMIVSLRGRNLDLLHVLFGSVLALDDGSLLLITTIASDCPTLASGKTGNAISSRYSGNCQRAVLPSSSSRHSTTATWN